MTSVVVPISPSSPSLCKNCAHFQKDGLHKLELGKCTKYGTVHLVSGKVKHEFAEIARKYSCKGNDFEAKLKTGFNPF